jgi:hypothetical protein
LPQGQILVPQTKHDYSYKEVTFSKNNSTKTETPAYCPAYRSEIYSPTGDHSQHPATLNSHSSEENNSQGISSGLKNWKLLLFISLSWNFISILKY